MLCAACAWLSPTWYVGLVGLYAACGFTKAGVLSTSSPGIVILTRNVERSHPVAQYYVGKPAGVGIALLRASIGLACVVWRSVVTALAGKSSSASIHLASTRGLCWHIGNSRSPVM